MHNCHKRKTNIDKMNEINNRELSKIEGGLGLVGTIVAGVVIGAAVNVMNNWEDFKAGVNEGINNR